MAQHAEGEDQRPKLPITTLVVMLALAALVAAAYNPFMNLVQHTSGKTMERLQQSMGSMEEAARRAASQP